MTYPASELIAKSFYLSGIVARGLETVSGDQAADGLDILNDILAEQSLTTRFIPYYTQVTQNMVIGQEKYSIPGLVNVATITFNIDDVRYSMRERGRNAYFGNNRVDNITSLPYEYHTERTPTGTDINFYFSPVDTYPFTITGKFKLTDVTFDSDLSAITERGYLSYLKYKLALRLADFYDVPATNKLEQRVNDFEHQLSNFETPDLTQQYTSTLAGTGVDKWGQVNLGKGWVP